MFVDYYDHPEHCTVEKIRVVLKGTLDDTELGLASGCVGYAFAVHYGGDGLSDPVEVIRRNGETAFTLVPAGPYRSNPENRSDFLQDAKMFIADGTPIRKTDRSGPGTRGTRLVHGLRQAAEIYLWEPELVSNHVEVRLNGRVVFNRHFLCSRVEADKQLSEKLEEYISVLQDRR